MAFRHAGHRVFGLLRSHEKAGLLKACEIEPILGEMQKPETYQKSARSAEVLVHCAQEKTPEGAALDRLTIENFIHISKEHHLPRAIIYTSGVWVYGNSGGRILDESDALNPIEIVKWRQMHEEIVLNSADAQLRTIVLRPGCVYGGGRGLTNLWF